MGVILPPDQAAVLPSGDGPQMPNRVCQSRICPDVDTRGVSDQGAGLVRRLRSERVVIGRRFRPGLAPPSGRTGNGGAGVVRHSDFSTPFPGSRRLPEVEVGPCPGGCLRIVRFSTPVRGDLIPGAASFNPGYRTIEQTELTRRRFFRPRSSQRGVPACPVGGPLYEHRAVCTSVRLRPRLSSDHV